MILYVIDSHGIFLVEIADQFVSEFTEVYLIRQDFQGLFFSNR
jgi:hypothetical protein